MESLCIRCKGKGLCGRPCKILNSFKESAPKPKLHFSGKSSPEIFVGRIGYPYVNSGILAPSENDNLSRFPSAKEWSENNFSIANILRLRGQLIYGRSKSNIKSENKIIKTTRELALSSKPVSTEFFLNKNPIQNFISDSVFAPITNTAPVRKVILEENPYVEKKVDYLTSDYDVKAITALKEMYKSRISLDQIQKILSVGLLGVKSSRRMVPTRWSITATDDTISSNLLKEIRNFKELEEFILLKEEYLGNYIYILLLPGSLSFEAIECWINPENLEKYHISKDYEGFFGRKDYARNVTGGYYAMRLPISEYLYKIKRQATVLVFRKINPEYYAPLGVGIVRQATNRAINSIPRKFDSLNQAIEEVEKDLVIQKINLRELSKTLKEYKIQKNLKQFY